MGNPFDPPTPVDPSVFKAGLMNQLKWNIAGDRLTLQAPFRGPYQVRVRDLRGTLIASASGFSSRPQVLDLKGASGRFAVIEAMGDGVNLRRTVTLP
jgi:hypothetical protein